MSSRSTFQALRFSRIRASSGPIRITYLDGADFDRPHIAFAIGRKVGGAVVRNRLRRRLRVIGSELSPQLRPGVYLITAWPEVVKLSFGELREKVDVAMNALIQRIDK